MTDLCMSYEIFARPARPMSHLFTAKILTLDKRVPSPHNCIFFIENGMEMKQKLPISMLVNFALILGVKEISLT